MVGVSEQRNHSWPYRLQVRYNKYIIHCDQTSHTQNLFLIAVKSFTELGPQLLKLPNVDYLLSEVFLQDPLERYFSHQWHRGGSNDNPTAEQVPLNAITLIQQQAIYRDLKTMNVEQEVSNLSASQPFKKCPRIRKSIQSLCRDGADAQYMQYLSKNRITSPQTR